MFIRPILLSLALSPILAQAQDPAIRLVQDMHFGGLQVADRGGMITLTHEGVRIALSPGLSPILRPTSQEARFQLSGPPRARFLLRLDPAKPLLAGPRGGQIHVESFFPSFPSLEGTFDTQGQAELRLGAKLDIQAGTPEGPYAFEQVILEMRVQGDREPRVARQSFGIRAYLRPVLKLSNGSPLDFGSLLPGSTEGTFSVAPDGSHRSTPGGGPRLVRGNPRPAAFLLSGPPGSGYSLQLPTRMLLTGPGAPLEVREFVCDLPVQGALPAGTVPFRVGASLVVPPGQASGLYRGLFKVSVCYQ